MRTIVRSLPSLIFLGILSLYAVACSSMVGEAPDAGNAMPDAAGPAPRDLGFDSDAFWAADPPPTYCALDGGMLPPPKPPGGTPDCPDDKNRQGCPCTTPGQTAACWPGLRKNRGLGICRDGTTTCVQNEVGSVWGACEGYVLPAPGATSGADACQCFSAGRWALDNLVPCFYSIGGKLVGAASSVVKDGKPTCIDMPKEPLTLPTQPWSKNTLNVDCVGRWTLCYTLKAGDAKNPQPGDCTIASVCTSGDYTTVDMSQALPQLPAWVTTTSAQVACADKFVKSGGYGEMSVDGITVTCDKVQKVFNRVNYCPLSCNMNPTAPECQNCGDGGSGSF
jgi:hypothetical protein